MLVEAKKRCSRCLENKPVSQFYSAAATYDDLRAECRACSAVRCRERRAANKLLPRDRAGDTKRCERCRAVFPASSFSRDAGSTDGLYRYCRPCNVIHARAHKYGLTKDRVQEMLWQTHCEACGKCLPSNSDKHIDHRHSDGAVRGILCDRCNTTLGKCEENPAIFMALCDYLARTANVDYRKQPYRVTISESAGQCFSRPTPPEAERTQCQTSSSQTSISPPQ